MERDEDRRPGCGPDDAGSGWDDDRAPYDYWDGRLTNEDFVDRPRNEGSRDEGFRDEPPRPDAPHAPDRPLYDGRPVRDPYERGGGYRRVSEAVWERARDEYLEGDSCATVCARHGMAESTLRQRAREQGWRRIDQPDPEPVDLDAEEEAGLLDYAQMARHALVRLNRAILRGRAAEAAGWMRLHTRLADLARAAAEPEPAASPAAVTPEPKPGPARSPDSQDAVMRRMRLVGDLSRALTGLDPRDPTGRRAIDLGLEALEAMRVTPISDDSYGSDSLSPRAALTPGEGAAQAADPPEPPLP